MQTRIQGYRLNSALRMAEDFNAPALRQIAEHAESCRDVLKRYADCADERKAIGTFNKLADACRAVLTMQAEALVQKANIYKEE